jgi:hypothetical protein
MTDLCKTDVKEVSKLDIKVTAALYLVMIDNNKDLALKTLAEVISCKPTPLASMRAWSNVFLLGEKAAGIVPLLSSSKLDKVSKKNLETFKERIN